MYHLTIWYLIITLLFMELIIEHPFTKQVAARRGFPMQDQLSPPMFYLSAVCAFFVFSLGWPVHLWRVLRP